MPVALTPARPNSAQPSDPKLDEACPRTLGELYDQFGAVAYSLAYSITANSERAERVVTLAFAATWNEHARKRAPVREFFPALMNAVRAGAVEPRGAQRVGVLRFEPSAPATSNGSIEQAVSQALQELPDVQRNVLALAYFGGLAVGEIAAELQAPMTNVKENLLAAMRHLRSVLPQRTSGVAAV